MRLPRRTPPGPHTLNFMFDQDVSASLSADDLRLEAITGTEPDPVVTAFT